MVTALLVVGSVAATCYPLGYRLLVDGALTGSSGQAAAGVVVVGGLLAIGWVLIAIGATEAMALSDRISRLPHQPADHPDQRRARAGTPGAAGLPDRGGAAQRQPAAARRGAAPAAEQHLRRWPASSTLLVLLASVSPWLLLLPVCRRPAAGSPTGWPSGSPSGPRTTWRTPGGWPG